MADPVPPTDPRIAAEASVRPVVARPPSGMPTWAIVVGAGLLGLLLFIVLDAHRRALTAPAVRPRPLDAIATSAPPLFVPPEPVVLPSPVLGLAPPMAAIAPSQRPPRFYNPAPLPSPPVYSSQAWTNAVPAAPSAPARIAQEPSLVIDTTAPRSAAASGSGGGATGGAEGGGTTAEESVAGARASAGVLANRTMTVPQGTLIPAVLETALDSTRPGLARALVSRDIRGFDGTRILIPRGSRLIGEYGSKNESGQKRLLVNWIRLIRPDGVTIAIDSPASDSLGRGGIKAKVNSHFFERFGGAILQSVLNIGVNLASRSTDSAVVVALPGTLQGGAQIAPAEQIRPTLKVKQATSISIFVARDLDFAGVESR